MTGKWPIRDALDWKTQFGLSVSLAFVLGLSLVLPITDCVVDGFGDVSGVLRTTWTLATGSATLISFVLAVRKYRVVTTESDPDDEPPDSHTTIHVESVEGDVDLNVTLGDDQRDQPNESAISRSPKDDAPDSPELNPEAADGNNFDCKDAEGESTE